MSNFIIDNDMPLPSSRARYPFSTMEVGQSFLINGDDRQVGNVRQAAHFYGKRNDTKFSVRKDGQKFRCWRVE